jgi:hypothetical protein
MPEILDKSPVPLAARIIGSVFGLIFFGVGITVLIFLWTSGDGLGAPPLVFKIFGSFIAIGFVTMGGALACSAMFGSGSFGSGSFASGSVAAAGANRISTPASPSSGYKCPNCGAPLGANADVSPSGDVKCAFCHAWFNVHRAA